MNAIRPAPRPDVKEARLQAHWAVQPIAAVGRALCEPQPDDSHTNMAWDRANGRLVGRRTRDGRRLALELRTLTLSVEGGEPLALAGRTLREAMAWAGDRMGADAPLEVPDYDLPDHAVRVGAPFDPPRELSAMAGWYDLAHVALEPFAGHPEGSESACWPHHFDLSVLLTLAGTADPARTVGVGLAPGDQDYDEPYFYTALWPDPDSNDAPELGEAGHWHEGGWTGAVLTRSDLLAFEDARHEEVVTTFLDRAVDGSRRLHGGGSE